ncbi:unnamed protein product [Polarella glacialis]|uniref:Subtilisin n=1 Tax=Polarella glacialis TaxID=89957 RepID=A0A813J3H8_POLGL|nr:unnamed protein product [Polarella glacialis]
MMSTVSTTWILCWLLLHALVGSALAAAEGGSPGACVGAEACVEEASEDDPVALLQARQPAPAAGADENWWRQRAGRSVAAAGAVVGSMTGEEPAEASHTQAVQTQDPLSPSVGSVTVFNATALPLSSSDLYEPAPAVLNFTNGLGARRRLNETNGCAEICNPCWRCLADWRFWVICC